MQGRWRARWPRAGRSLPIGVGVFGLGEQRLHLIDAATDQRPDRPGQAQPRPGLDHLGGQRRQPAIDGRALAVLEAFLAVLLDAGRPSWPPRQPGHDPRPHRPARWPPARRPRCGAAPAHGRDLRAGAGAQQVGEQAVVAPPASFLVQGNQEQVGPLDLLQGGLAAPWPVTASHSGPDRRPRIDVSSSRTSWSGWRASTSSVR